MVKFIAGTAAEVAASVKTGNAGDLVTETDTGNLSIADGATTLGDLKRLARVDEVPLLDEDGKVPEENVPDRLSAPGLSASTVAIAGTIAGSDTRQVWSLDPAVAGGGYTPTQRTAYIQTVLAEVGAAGGGTIDVPGVEFVFARSNVTNVIGLHELLFEIPANTRLVGIAGSKFTLDPTTTPSATGLLLFQLLGSDCAVSGVDFNANEGVIAKRSQIATKQLTSNVATIVTQTAHGFQVGDSVAFTGTANVVAGGATSSLIDGNRTVASVVDATTFTVAVTGANQALSTLEFGWVQLQSTVAGSIWILGSRRLSGDLTRVDNISVTRCRFRDCRIGVTAAQSQPTDRGTDRWVNWSVTDCDFQVSSNRAIELAQINGATISRNTFTDVATAIHLVSFVKNFVIDSNRGTVGTLVNSPGAVMINYGVTDGIISRNVFGFGALVYSNGATLRFHTETVVTATNTVANITLSGNRWGAPLVGSTKRSLSFLSAAGNTDNEWQDITFHGDTFAGDLLLYTSSQQSIGHIKRIIFNGCVFDAPVLTLASGTFDLTDTQFTSCWFKSATATAVLANRVALVACRFTATPTIDSGADKTIIANSITPAAISSAGTNTQLSGNLVLV